MVYCYTIGKSFLLKTFASLAMKRRLNVCMSAPTGKLASTYAEQFPDCRANTVHTNFFILVGNNQEPNMIYWSLSDVHVLLVDEVLFFIKLILYITDRKFTQEKNIIQMKLIFYLFLFCKHFKK